MKNQKFVCPGCQKRRALDGGLLCPACYDAAVAENAKTPSRVVSMPDALWREVAPRLLKK